MEQLEQRVVLNAAPVAEPDFFSTAVDQAHTFSAADLTANDTDPDGDALAVVGLRGFPQHGSLLLDGGAFTYTPHAGFHGQETLSYVVSDGQGHDVFGSYTITARPSRTKVF